MTALRALKDRLRNREFTTAEASAMLGLSGVQVNNLIDELAQLGIAHSKDRKRAIEYRGLFSLKLCRDLIRWDVGPALRLKVIQAALDAPRKKFVEHRGHEHFCNAGGQLSQGGERLHSGTAERRELRLQQARNHARRALHTGYSRSRVLDR